MVLFLNLIPFFIGIAAAVSLHRISKSKAPASKRRGQFIGTCVITLLAFFVYSQVQPSYIPKGTVSTNNMAIPSKDYYVNEELPPIEDRLLSATPEEERQADLKEMYDWRQQIEAAKKAEASE